MLTHRGVIENKFIKHSMNKFIKCKHANWSLIIEIFLTELNRLCKMEACKQNDRHITDESIQK